ncbi:MAG TPA: nitronate monooxygenase [Acetobacteraceae bacterium]|nr:nitronate monooxygenase [Acetobacteraceae bacterium]
MDPIARLGLDVPVIQAPMAGGFTPAALVAAVSRAGALGSFGCAYMNPDDIRQAAASVRDVTDRPFGMNLFVHPDERSSPGALKAALEALSAVRTAAGLPAHPSLPARLPLDRQVEAVLDARPALFSTTFGPPTPAMIAACRARGILIAGTATTPEEGVLLDALGVDIIVAQGAEAGGHRGTFTVPWREAMIGTLPLVSLLTARIQRPVVASGGIMDARAVRAVLAAGAAAAQLGTAFLLCPEAGTPEPHRRMIADPHPRPTIVTSVYTGRPARGIHNRFADDMAFLEGATPAFDDMNALTRDLRKAAAGRGDAEWMSLWAGQAYPLARAAPAADIVRSLAI